MIDQFYIQPSRQKTSQNNENYSQYTENNPNCQRFVFNADEVSLEALLDPNFRPMTNYEQQQQLKQNNNNNNNKFRHIIKFILIHQIDLYQQQNQLCLMNELHLILLQILQHRQINHFQQFRRVVVISRLLTMFRLFIFENRELEEKFTHETIKQRDFYFDTPPTSNFGTLT